jgi:hypothetical protein
MQWVWKPTGHFHDDSTKEDSIPCNCFGFKAEFLLKILYVGDRKRVCLDAVFLKQAPAG